MGLMLAEPGFHTRAFVEWEGYPRDVLISAQRAGYFAPAPIWDDVTTFDGKPFRGAIDTILAGYPCQPFSMAGQRKGADDERHLWPDVARVISEIEPRWVFLENVAGHLSLGLETVLRDLWRLGFTPAAGLFSAGETGTSHERQRVFIVAYRGNAGFSRSGGDPQHGSAVRQFGDDCREEMANPNSQDGRTDSGRPNAGANGRNQFAGSGGKLDHAKRVGSEQGLDTDGGNERHVSGAAGEHALGHASLIGCGEGRAEPVLRFGRDTASGSGGTMADPDVGNPGAERQQRSGKQRFQPEGGYSGAERAGVGLAHTGRAGLEGREWRGSPDQRDRTPAHGSVAERGCPRLFPPGPADMAGWAETLAGAPYLAPSASFGDCIRFADQVAAMAQAGLVAEAEIEPDLRRMADGLAHRARALRLLGNGVHPLAAAHAWRSLAAAHGLRPVDMDAADRDAATATDDAHMRAAE